ncbi:hypothetical protein [Salinirussus salinus]|uniref:hypothetical protein n=1 Tax=Salinirussus salinus TaxID=1198300 RepID=UPI00135CD296|nr:hypothetical protein [Salinirussus salinus]
MTDGRTRRVFVEMFREEWRLHSRLFGGGRFAAFPLLVAALVAATTELLVVTGTAPDTVFAGLHALALVFGLHTGSIGLVGRDALRGLLGDLTLLVFSARTLPLSRGRLLGVFVVKDVVYYTALFLLPMALGTLPAVLAGEGGATAGAAGAGGVATSVLLVWATLTLTFVLGIGATLAGLGLSRLGLPGWAGLAAAGAAAGAAWVGGVDVVAYTPYGVFLAPALPRAAGAAALVAAVFLVGALTFGPTTRPETRTVGPAFRRWLGRVGDPVAAKTLLDVHRSAGGVGKVLFSGAILFGVTAALVDLAGRITGVSPSVGVSFGAVLGLSGFTTYNWLTQAEDVDSYLAHPLGVGDVFAGKLRAFLLLGPLVGLGFYALALAWRGGPPLEAAVGAALLVGVACYIFGVTVYLTGLSPDEFLFDTALYAVFGAAMVVPLVPVLLVGFAVDLSPPVLAGLAAGSLLLGAVGLGLFRRSVPRWERRYRE